MTSKYSSIPQVIDYLFAEIQSAAAGLADTVISDGYPGTEQTPNIIAIGGTTKPVADGDATPVSMGARFIQESFEVDLTLSSFVGGTDEKVARDAAFSLYDIVVGVIAKDFTLGGNCTWALPSKLAVDGSNFDTAAAGVIVDLTFAIRVSSRIQLV